MKAKRRSPHKWTKKQEQYLIENIKGTPRKTMCKMFNNRFNLDLNEMQIKSRMDKLGLKNGLDGRFQKGQPPANKGLKQTEYMSPEAIERTKATRFKKGVVPANTKPLGATRICKRDKIKFRKVKMKGPQWVKWKAEHHIVWEKANGPIPKGHRIIALDGDLTNTDLDNLRMISGRTAGYMARSTGFYDDRELNELSLGIALVQTKIHQLESEADEN